MKNGTCAYFNGVQHDCCKKGVAYSSFPVGKRPCIQFIEQSVRGGTLLKPGEIPATVKSSPMAMPKEACAHYTEPTAEQVQKYRQDIENAWNKTMVALAVAGKWRVKPKPAQDRREVVECPVCKGRLHLSQSSYNGHVHGKCETNNCVQWME